MNQKNKKIIIGAIIALIIVAGIATVTTLGFNKELRFEQGQRIDILVEQKVDETKIKNIAEEVLGMHNSVQTVEIYQEMVTIKARTITEEQRNWISEVMNFETYTVSELTSDMKYAVEKGKEILFTCKTDK